MEERSIKKLMTSIKCVSCGQNYETGNIDVLGNNDDLWFLKVLCSSCHTQSLVAAVVKESYAPEVITDLSETEVETFLNTGVVNTDDVLNMHKFLKDFDGDFSCLFGQEYLR